LVQGPAAAAASSFFADTGLKRQPDQASPAMQQGVPGSLFCVVGTGVPRRLGLTSFSVPDLTCPGGHLLCILCTLRWASTPHVVRVVAGAGGDPGPPCPSCCVGFSCGNGDHPLIYPGRWAEKPWTTQRLDGAGPAPRGAACCRTLGFLERNIRKPEDQKQLCETWLLSKRGNDTTSTPRKIHGSAKRLMPDMD
jgi:hypothetical protein